MALVYLLTNRVNGKRYIGATVKTVEQRFYGHVWEAERGDATRRPILLAIRKHGADVFDKSVLSECCSFAEALKIERLMIEAHQPEYNVAAGGIGPTNVRWTRKRRHVMGIKLRAAWTKERKEHHSRLMKKKIASGLFDSTKLHRVVAKPKAVVCISDGKWFPSAGDAAANYGVNPKSIQSVCSGVTLSTKGLEFVYSAQPMGPDVISKIKSRRDARKKANAGAGGRARCRPVVCITDSKVYGSAIAAAKAYGIWHSRVTTICQKGGETKDGLVFRYLDEPVRKAPMNKAQRRAISTNRLKEMRPKAWAKRSAPVVCTTTGQAYKSAKEAARAVGVGHASIWNAIKYSHGNIKGLHFAFVDNGAP